MKYFWIIPLAVIISVGLTAGIIFSLDNENEEAVDSMSYGTHCFVEGNPNDRESSCVLRALSDCNSFIQNAGNLGYDCDNLCSIDYSSLNKVNGVEGSQNEVNDRLFWKVICTK